MAFSAVAEGSLPFGGVEVAKGGLVRRRSGRGPLGAGRVRWAATILTQQVPSWWDRGCWAPLPVPVLKEN